MYPLVEKPGLKTWQFLAVMAAIAAISAVIYLALRPVETPFTRAVALIRAGKAAAAIPILEELYHQQPDNSAVFPWLAQGYLTTERLAEGRTALDTALRLKLPPETLLPVVLAYANYYEGRGDFDEAEKLFDSAHSACPGKGLTTGLARLYLQWSESEASGGELNEAVSHLEQAATLLPEVDDASLKISILHKLAQCYRQLAAIAETKDSNDAAAIKLLEKSLVVADEPATRMALAEIYTKLGNQDEALKNYSIVSQADQNNLEARHRLIDILVDKKDYPRAQQALMDLVDREKSLENYQLLVAVDLKMENYAGAVHSLEDAINLKANDPDLLGQLETTLRDWANVLIKAGKLDEASSVKGHADRVAEMLADLTKVEEKPEEADQSQQTAFRPWDPSTPPIALCSSRIWLAPGSLTPEGEIQIRNITHSPVSDLALTVVFYDKTSKVRNGTVILPVASATSKPFEADALRSLYFSCPNIVKSDHQLAVKILWKGNFLKELPVVKSS